MKAILVERCGSTMDLAKLGFKSQSLEKSASVFAYLTLAQTKGRGRQGSDWLQSQGNALKPSNENSASEISLNEVLSAGKITSFDEVFSQSTDFLPVTFQFPYGAIQVPLSWVSLLVGCAVKDALSKTWNQFLSLPQGHLFSDPSRNVFIKWPNDLVYLDSHLQWKKFGGILCETQVQGSHPEAIFVGLGLNFFTHPSLPGSTSIFEMVSQRSSPKTIKPIRQFLGNEEIRKYLLTSFALSLEKELMDYLTVKRQVGHLRNLVEERMMPKGTFVSVDKSKYCGRFVGLSGDGAIQIDGYDSPIYSGEVELGQLLQQSSTGNRESPLDAADKIPQEFSAVHLPTLELKKQITLKKHLKYKESLQNERKNQSDEVVIHSQVVQIYAEFGNTNLHFMIQKNSLEPFFDSLSIAEFENQGVLEEFFSKVMPTSQSVTLHFYYASVRSIGHTHQIALALQAELRKNHPEVSFKFQQMTLDNFPALRPFQNQYPTPMGMDRLLRFQFIYRKAKALDLNVACVSFGTATTLEACSPKGEILMSLITPGLQLSLNALSKGTSLLPELQFKDYKAGSAIDTYSSMLNGVLWSSLGLVLSALLKGNITRIFMTGGGALAVLESEPCQVLQAPFPSLKMELVPGLELLELAHEIESSRKIPTPTAHQTQLVIQNMESKRVLNYQAGELEVDDSLFRRIGGRIENIGMDQRLDGFLGKKYPFHTRQVWGTRALAKEVKVEHLAPKSPTQEHVPRLSEVKDTYRLQKYDQIWVFHPPEHEPSMLKNLEIEYDDSDVIAFHKPPNMVVHAAGMYGRNTFVEIKNKMGYGQASAVHRIDRETSGLLLCARTFESRSLLSKFFREGKINKIYLAVTRGILKVPQECIVDMPLGNAVNSKIRLKTEVFGENALEAKTYFKCLSQVGDYGLWLCFPLTGRTNQIRAHFEGIGLWIVGDKMFHPEEEVFMDYYENGLSSFVLEKAQMPRHYLHNVAIGLSHLVSDLERSRFKEVFAKEGIVSSLPPDMMEQEFVRDLFQSAGFSWQEESQFKNEMKQYLKILDHLDLTQIAVVSTPLR